MQFAKIQGETRRREGRHSTDRLRRRGMIPAVIYGHGEAPELVALSKHDTELALGHMQHVVELEIDGRGRQLLIKDVQYDHLHQTPVHLDLMRVDPNERVRVRVPLEFKGTPAGVLHGGTMVHLVTEIHVECPLLRIPPSIRVHVERIELSQSLHAKEIELPADVKLVDSPDEIIAVVQPPRGMTAGEAEAIAATDEGAEPEVIRKGSKEEEEGEGSR